MSTTKTNITLRKMASISDKLAKSGAGPARIHVIPQKGSWAVKKEGAKRAYAVVDTMKSAIVRAKDIARSQSVSSVVVHKRDGTIAKTLDNSIPSQIVNNSSG